MSDNFVDQQQCAISNTNHDQNVPLSLCLSWRYELISYNKIQDGDILVLAYPGCPGKLQLNKGHRCIKKFTIILNAMAKK